MGDVSYRVSHLVALTTVSNLTACQCSGSGINGYSLTVYIQLAVIPMHAYMHISRVWKHYL